MKSLPVYNLIGEEVAQQQLIDELFAIPKNEVLIKQVLDAQMSNSRLALAHTKTRSFVRGGGKKPWRQKGTGRARHGSIRSPLWKGGGVTFGPSADRNFCKQVNKKVRKKAIKMLLSDKAVSDNLKLFEDFQINEIKTKKVLDILNKVVKGEKTLIAIDKKNKNLALSVRNLPHVNIIMADSLNVYDLLKYSVLVMPVPALDILAKTYLDKKVS